MPEALSKLDFAKYLSRSFILPAMGMCGIFWLAGGCGWKGQELLYPGGIVLCLSGVFSAQDIIKLVLGKKDAE